MRELVERSVMASQIAAEVGVLSAFDGGAFGRHPEKVSEFYAEFLKY
jgi:hypothetical protein